MSRIFITLDAPHEWVLTNPRGAVMDKGVSDDLSLIRIPRQINEVIGIAGGQSVTIRGVMVPGKRRGNVEAALPYALEDSLTEDVEQLHFTLLRWRPGEQAITAIVSRSRMERWSSGFASAGISLDRIVPAYLLLPLHDERSCTVCRLDADNVYVRNGELNGFSMDQTFFEYWLESESFDNRTLSFTDLEQAQSAAAIIEQSADKPAEIRHWDIGHTMADWLRADPEQKAVAELSLLHGEYTPAHLNRSYRPLKIAALCALLAVSLFTLSMWRQTDELLEREQTIKQQTLALFKQRFPGEPYLGRPQVQVNALLSAAGGAAGNTEFQRLVKAISDVSRSNGATIEEINFRDQEMTVLCNVNSLAVLDTIRSQLQGLPDIQAELLSSGARDNQVSGRFRLSAAGS